MILSLDEQQCRNLEVSGRKEWLLTNGIGGFSMGTVAGLNTRRYHGYLVAAVNPPADRMVLLESLEIFIQSDGLPHGISNHQYPGAIFPEGYQFIESCTVGDKIVWNYRADDMNLEQTVVLHPNENACTIRFRNTGTKAFQVTVRPLVCHKPYHSNFSEDPSYPHEIQFAKTYTQLTHDGIDLFLSHGKAHRSPVQGWYYRFEHAMELERGLPPRDDLYCPVELQYELMPGEVGVLVASTPLEVAPYDIAEEAPGAGKFSEPLRQAAAKYFVSAEDRTSIIAGYPWFTDWGRDTMISLPGLCIPTGRLAEGRQIVLDYAARRNQGLIPNRFVEGDEDPAYNTVDATLWMGNAIYKLLEKQWDEPFARECVKILDDVITWHQKGTYFGIKVDSKDGLLSQGEEGVQLTWMDAKVGDWVITPRHGKPVEINGLWVNLLRVAEWLCQNLGTDGSAYTKAAEKAESNFDKKFWQEHRGHYLDTADPDDASLRPNQIIAMALPFGPAKGPHAEQALEVVTRELMTPVGLRTLGPQEPEYQGRWEGNMNDRDAAYHQGTVWPWLLGPYVSALVKIKGDKKEAKEILRNAKNMVQECGLFGISEVYDGDEPHRPGGCPWQAWSTAEILRAWTEDLKGD